MSLTKPYVSVVVARFEARKGVSTLTSELMEEFTVELGFNSDDVPRQLLSKTDEASDNGLRYALLHYKEYKAPSWLMPNQEYEIRDALNHLLLICRRSKHIAFYMSDPAARAVLLRRLKSSGGDGAFTHLTRVSRKVLTDAFMGGKATTLWLSGIHRRTAVKADSKILSGIDLQSALNPLDDQTYHFTAARTMTGIAGGSKPIGLSQKNSSIWLGTSKNWPEFRDYVKASLDAIKTAEKAPLPPIPPLPILAGTTLDSSEVSDAFDIAFVPPELLSADPGFDAAELELAEKWAFRTEFSVTESDGTNASAEVFLDGEELATAKFEVTIVGPDNVSVAVTAESAPNADKSTFDEFLKTARNKRWLKIRYESGQTLSDGSLFSMQFRDQQFDGWRFEDLGETQRAPETNPKKEKPFPAGHPRQFAINEIGKQDSLFCWTVNHWFGLADLGSEIGWLASDDGAGEIADFIHLDLKPDDGGLPRLSLIHVKGSKSDDINRRISVSDYEIVCGQAVKNLRFSDRVNLADQLKEGMNKEVASAVWKDGKKQDDRTGMIDDLRKLGSGYRRRIVVFQPRVTNSQLTAARNAAAIGGDGSPVQRLRQLNTLLLGVESDCRDLGADFLVLASNL